jgi:hypothetical protein
MKLIHRIALKARAAHRLARQKRWPAYVFAAAAQEFPHDVPDHPVATLVLKAIHMYVLYVSFSLID